jgi:pimeloyl-ACP methyl ester carboxylesterase
VIEPPEIRSVRTGSADIAYSVFGNGSRDLLICSGLGANVDLIWQISTPAEFLQKPSRFRLVIFMDWRGSGASDPVPLMAVPTWQEMTEDITAVLDAAGSDVTDLLALDEIGPIAILVAAMHPERVGSGSCSRSSEARALDRNQCPRYEYPGTQDLQALAA